LILDRDLFNYSVIRKMDYYKPKQTERLSIRPLTCDDAITWNSFVSDDRATKFFPESMKSEPLSAETWLKYQLERYKNKKYGLMGLVEQSTGSLIGQAGLLIQSINKKDELEIGYHLLPDFWGNGYATEAAKFFKRFAFDNKLSTSVISIIHVNNKASQKVAKRNGMAIDKKVLFRKMPAFIYRIDKSEHFLNINRLTSN